MQLFSLILYLIYKYVSLWRILRRRISVSSSIERDPPIQCHTNNNLSTLYMAVASVFYCYLIPDETQETSQTINTETEVNLYFGPSTIYFFCNKYTVIYLIVYTLCVINFMCIIANECR